MIGIFRCNFCHCIQALAALGSLGYSQQWQNVLGSRAYNVTYYNTTGKPIGVNVGGNTNTSATAFMTINGVNIAGSSESGNPSYGAIFAVVPVGGSYSAYFNLGTPSLTLWAELR